MDPEKPYYYLNAAQETLGPKTLPELEEMMEAGTVKPDTLIAAVGDPKWIRLEAALNGAAPATVTDGKAGVCPRCGAGLETVDGSLPANCPSCGFAADTPHSAQNLLTNFWFTLTKKYWCFRGRATRVEFWSFVLFAWLIGQASDYIFGTIRALILGINETQAQIQERLTNEIMECADSIEGLSQLDTEILKAAGLLPTDGVTTAAYAASLGVLALHYAVNLAIVPPYWGVMVRRLHDVGWSGKWCGAFVVIQLTATAGVIMFFTLLPGLFVNLAQGNVDADTRLWFCGLFLIAVSLLTVIGLLLFVLCLLDSKRGPNKYGPSPKYPLG